MSVTTLYCDESGFTGNNLLQQDQPYFAFASVAISRGEASELVQKTIKDFGIQGAELKGNRLLKFATGRKAVATVLAALEGRKKTMVFEKKFSLAAKIFEYVFEPALSQNNSLFYRLEFHLFVANLLYLHFTQKARYAEEIFGEFERFIRTHDESQLVHATSNLLYPVRPPVLELVAAFCVANMASVREELANLAETDAAKWILDLSGTGIYSLLCEWAEEHDELEVLCDESKPIAANKTIHDAMIGRKEKAYHTLFGEQRRVTFNLVRELQLISSHDHPGIQLADVVAAATTTLAANSRDRELDPIRDGVASGLAKHCVIPDLDFVNPDALSVQRNFLILQELVRRSLAREPLLPRMPEFVIEVSRMLALPEPDFTRDLMVVTS